MVDSGQSRIYRAAVVACGRISRAHARGYLAHPQIELAACADISSEALEAFGSEFNVPSQNRYLDYREMLDREKPDLVSICSLHDLHASMTIDATVCKPRAILCEKPIALSLAEADAMMDACRRSGTLLIVGHQRRFGPQYEAAHQALEAGEIGELQSIETHGHPGCSLMVDGTHTVDLIRWYAGDGPINWVFGQIDAREHRSAWGGRVENAALVLFRFSSGVRALMTLGHHSSQGQGPGLDPLWPDVPPGTYHQIILHGTKGQIEIDGDAPVEGRPWVRLVENGAVEEIPLPWARSGDPRMTAHALVVQAMLESLETGVPHTLDASSARATLEVLMAAYESSRRRTVVELPLEVSENPLFDMLDRGEM
jgi:predicted dehydrogenase